MFSAPGHRSVDQQVWRRSRSSVSQQIWVHVENASDARSADFAFSGRACRRVLGCSRSGQDLPSSDDRSAAVSSPACGGWQWRSCYRLCRRQVDTIVWAQAPSLARRRALSNASDRPWCPGTTSEKAEAGVDVWARARLGISPASTGCACRPIGLERESQPGQQIGVD
ncbi:hypothetical protein OH76DRAFT_243353 [Lentinus brumalis]|uniref:Uncharacterized protein n=1 Tax=Lentinus brumalis TaxID=2498619 RepID=A0A371DHS4_9APHY|nr:hypothetical protein OH76DRAFT_243353 [Polyporus brumalis]